MFSLKEHTSIMILLVIRTQTNISNEIRPFLLPHGHIPFTHRPEPRAMSSAVSSNRLSLCGHTSSCTVPLSSRQAFAKDVALLTPTDRAKCPIWRCKLLNATVSASTSPMRPTPGRRTEDSEKHGKSHGFTWIYTSLYRENDDSLEKNHATLFSDKWRFHQPQ